MGSILYLIMVAALTVAPQFPARAQDTSQPEQNSAPQQNPVQVPGQASPPPVQQPQPQPQPSEPSNTQDSNRDANADSDNRRFMFHRVDGTLLRLDMRTGTIAACAQSGSEWNCVPGRDDRAALDREIAQLQRDNAVLKNTLLEHGVPLPAGMTPAPPSAGGWWDRDETIPRPPQTVPPSAVAPPAQGAPSGASDSGIDRVLDAVEKGWQRLVEIMTNLRREWEK